MVNRFLPNFLGVKLFFKPNKPTNFHSSQDSLETTTNKIKLFLSNQVGSWSTLGSFVLKRIPLKFNLMIFTTLIQKRLRIMRASQGQVGVPLSRWLHITLNRRPKHFDTSVTSKS